MSQRRKAEVHAETRRREKMEGKQAIVLDTDAASPSSGNANTSEDCGMTKKNAKAPILHATHGEFYESVADLLRNARANAYRVVNFTMVEAYWNIGRMIVEEEQQGQERAEYGAALIKNLSIRLSEEFGKGFTESNLWNFRQFYLAFLSQDPQSRKLYALRRELTWTHYRLLMREKSPMPGRGT